MAPKELITNPSTSAVALMRATTKLFGDFIVWEPESLWLNFDRENIDVPVENRDKIMAAVALRLVPAFYWDAVVFEKTCVAFSGRPAHTLILEEPPPGDLAWGVIEAAWIRKLYDDQPLKMEHEPIAYTAVVLERAGFVMAPKQLDFASEELKRRLPKSDFYKEVSDRWKATEKSSLADIVLHETRIDVQIARLAAVSLHVKSRTEAAEAELKQLK